MKNIKVGDRFKMVPVRDFEVGTIIISNGVLFKRGDGDDPSWHCIGDTVSNGIWEYEVIYIPPKQPKPLPKVGDVVSSEDLKDLPFGTYLRLTDPWLGFDKRVVGDDGKVGYPSGTRGWFKPDPGCTYEILWLPAVDNDSDNK